MSEAPNGYVFQREHLWMKNKTTNWVMADHVPFFFPEGIVALQSPEPPVRLQALMDMCFTAAGTHGSTILPAIVKQAMVREPGLLLAVVACPPPPPGEADFVTDGGVTLCVTESEFSRLKIMLFMKVSSLMTSRSVGIAAALI